MVSTGEDLEVRLVLSCLKPETYPRINGSHWLGDLASVSSQENYQYVEDLILRFDGAVTHERVGAYADLLSVDGFVVEISESEIGPVVTLSGSGGAAGTWAARLQNEDRILVERYVTSDNFRDEAFALTRYGQPGNN